MPYSSVIIPTLGRAKLLSDTLNSLARQSERDFETIIVCDGEDDTTQALAERYVAPYPINWIFNSNNAGPASARNLGAEKASGEVLLFLDDDAWATTDSILHHCKHHYSQRKEIVVVGSRQESYLHEASSITERLLREASAQWLAQFEARRLRRGGDFSWFPHCGINSSIRRDTFRNTGGFNSTLRMAEDVDLGCRLLARGAQLISEPLAVIFHRNSKNLNEHRISDARVCGQTDVYRARQKGQRIERNQGLLRLQKAKGARKLKERVAWECPNITGQIGKASQLISEKTGSRLFFRLSHGLLMSASYWEGVRSEGVTLNKLAELIGFPLPVLLFHSISNPADENERKYHLSSARFRQFVRWLRDANYRNTDPVELLSAPMAPRRVMLTFDDGYEDFYVNCFPVLKQLGFNATLFIVVDRIGKSNLWDAGRGFRSRKLLSLQQLRELQRHGFILGSHSLTHAWLPGLTDDELRREVSDSKARLEDLIGSEIICFAYPGGGVDERVMGAVAEAGYKMALTAEPGLSLWDDPLAIRRIGLSEDDLFVDFKRKLMTGENYRRGVIAQLRRAVRYGAEKLPDPAPRMIKQAVHWLRR